MWHSRPPRDPPPFMANAILNFHFDFPHPSLMTTKWDHCNFPTSLFNIWRKIIKLKVIGPRNSCDQTCAKRWPSGPSRSQYGPFCAPSLGTNGHQWAPIKLRRWDQYLHLHIKSKWDHAVHIPIDIQCLIIILYKIYLTTFCLLSS